MVLAGLALREGDGAAGQAAAEIGGCDVPPIA